MVYITQRCQRCGIGVGEFEPEVAVYYTEADGSRRRVCTKCAESILTQVLAKLAGRRKNMPPIVAEADDMSKAPPVHPDDSIWTNRKARRLVSRKGEEVETFLTNEEATLLVQMIPTPFAQDIARVSREDRLSTEQEFWLHKLANERLEDEGGLRNVDFNTLRWRWENDPPKVQRYRRYGYEDNYADWRDDIWDPF